MNKIVFRFYAELNDFLPTNKKNKEIIYDYQEASSIKDIIESLGVPHTEIDLIIVNGDSVDFDYLPHNEDRISVYPLFYLIDISSLSLVRPKALSELKFVLDVHLGKLVSFLRMLGIDVLYPENYDDENLAKISSQEDRILLTRDRGLLKRTIVKYGYCVRETDPEKQFIEIVTRFNLKTASAIFQRCLTCNGKLALIDKEQIIDQLQPKTLQHYQEFFQCQHCQQIFWKGSHFQRMQQFITQLLEKV